jgi:hypothetical protein
VVAEDGPVIEISGRFRDAGRAKAVADAMNGWFKWIVAGSIEPMPRLFDELGVAWTLEDDVDWTLGPHARVAGDEVRVAIHTEDTHLRIAGLLRLLGGQAIRMVHDAGGNPAL